jgi:hypothetical protein
LLLVWRRALIGAALAACVWLYGTFGGPGGGLDGPCLGAGEFIEGARERSDLRNEWSWLPPGPRCVEEHPDGSRREQTYPGPVTFAVAGAALLVPFAFPRRDRPGGPSPARASGDRG